MTAVMIVSGFLRAKRPLAQTDLPFLLTILALFTVAMLPPPAIILSGPLCASLTFATSIERLARAFVFSLLYSIFVYAAAPPVQTSTEVIICVMRASSATIWVLGAHQVLLPLALVQGGAVIYVRIFGEEQQIEYDHVPIAPASNEIDPEYGLETPSPSKATEEAPASNGSAGDLIVPAFGGIGTRGLVDIGAAAGAGCVQRSANGFDAVDIAAVAARLEAEGQ
jgi:hypothetical protein